MKEQTIIGSVATSPISSSSLLRLESLQSQLETTLSFIVSVTNHLSFHIFFSTEVKILGSVGLVYGIEYAFIVSD